jgi:hypothetical protein
VPFEAASALYKDKENGWERAVLLLLPVVLGLERVNSVYAEQLMCVLSWPQSVGIVGGKPGHSYYFIGHQGSRLLCLDPHSLLSTKKDPEDVSSHVAADVLPVPVTAIDSTMALAFLCCSATDAHNLCNQIQALSDEFKSAPLVSIGTMPPPEAVGDGAWADDSDHEESRSPPLSIARCGSRVLAEMCSAPDAECMATDGTLPNACTADELQDVALEDMMLAATDVLVQQTDGCSSQAVCLSDSSSVGGSPVAVPQVQECSPCLASPRLLSDHSVPARRPSGHLACESNMGSGAGWELVETTTSDVCIDRSAISAATVGNGLSTE